MSGGRPAHYADMIRQMIADGTLETLIRGAWCEKEVYQALEISPRKWIQLKQEVPELMQLVSSTLRSRKELFLLIKEAMLKKALGYYYTEEIITTKTDTGTIQTHKKYIHPELATQKLMLGNIAKLERMKPDPDPEIAGWTNATDPMTFRAKGKIATGENTQALFEAEFQAVLDDLEERRQAEEGKAETGA